MRAGFPSGTSSGSSSPNDVAGFPITLKNTGGLRVPYADIPELGGSQRQAKAAFKHTYAGLNEKPFRVWKSRAI